MEDTQPDEPKLLPLISMPAVSTGSLVPQVAPSVLPPVPAPVKLPVPGVPASPETKLINSEYTRFRGRGKYRAWA